MLTFIVKIREEDIHQPHINFSIFTSIIHTMTTWCHDARKKPGVRKEPPKLRRLGAKSVTHAHSKLPAPRSPGLISRRGGPTGGLWWARALSPINYTSGRAKLPCVRLSSDTGLIRSWHAIGEYRDGTRTFTTPVARERERGGGKEREEAEKGFFFFMWAGGLASFGREKILMRACGVLAVGLRLYEGVGVSNVTLCILRGLLILWRWIIGMEH